MAPKITIELTKKRWNTQKELNKEAKALHLRQQDEQRAEAPT
jgi:hypothetical protein